MKMHLNLRANIALGLIFAFLANSFGPICPIACSADAEFRLPAPGHMVALSPAFSPAVLKGIKLDPQNPFRFHFFVDRGETSLSQEKLKSESSKLIKYFLASLTIPEKDLWVNLSPYEKDRIVPQEFGQTEMGRDLLAEDYLLKQITASIIYPESQLGKEFWQKVYAQAQAKYGTTNIPINTFNKVWIVPEKAVVYENGGTAFVLENHLKVMLEQDYLALQKHVPPLFYKEGARGSFGGINAIGSQIVREIVIPALNKEVNEGKNFAQLRQVFYSLILATWYKKKIKDSILNKVYADKNKIEGVKPTVSLRGRSVATDEAISKRTTSDVEMIYSQYLQAFKKGVYNYIKEEPDPITNEGIPRKYFSGGVIGEYMDAAIIAVGPAKVDRAAIADVEKRLTDVVTDMAMTSARNPVVERIIQNLYIQIYLGMGYAKQTPGSNVVELTESMPVEYGKFEETLPEVLDEFVNFADLKEGAKVFDFGSGDGMFAYRLAARGFSVEGMEQAEKPFSIGQLISDLFLRNLGKSEFQKILAPEDLSSLKQTVSKVNLKKGDIFSSDVDFSRYDVVYLYYPEPTHNAQEFIQKFSEQMRKARGGLKKETKLIILRQNKYNPVQFDGLSLLRHRTFSITSNPNVEACTLYEYTIAPSAVDGSRNQTPRAKQADRVVVPTGDIDSKPLADAENIKWSRIGEIDWEDVIKQRVSDEIKRNNAGFNVASLIADIKSKIKDRTFQKKKEFLEFLKAEFKIPGFGPTLKSWLANDVDKLLSQKMELNANELTQQSAGKADGAMKADVEMLDTPITDPNEIFLYLTPEENMFEVTELKRQERVGYRLIPAVRRALDIIKGFDMFSIHGNLIYDHRTNKNILITGMPGTGKSNIASRLIKDPRFSIRADGGVIAYFDSGGVLQASASYYPEPPRRAYKGKPEVYASAADIKLGFIPVSIIINSSFDRDIQSFKLNTGRLNDRFNDNYAELQMDQDKADRIIKASDIFGINVLLPEPSKRNYDALATEIMKVLPADGAMNSEQKIISPDNIQGAIPENLGEKPEKLIWLKQAGFNVPKFFVIKSNGSGKLVIDDQLRQAFDSLKRPVIVRSAHPEEGKKHSYSGIFDSYGNISVLTEAEISKKEGGEEDWLEEQEPKSVEKAYEEIVAMARDRYRVQEYRKALKIVDFDPNAMNTVIMEQIDVDVFGMFVTSDTHDSNKMLIHYQMRGQEGNETGGVIAYDKKGARVGEE